MDKVDRLLAAIFGKIEVTGADGSVFPVSVGHLFSAGIRELLERRARHERIGLEITDELWVARDGEVAVQTAHGGISLAVHDLVRTALIGVMALGRDELGLVDDQVVALRPALDGRLTVRFYLTPHLVPVRDLIWFVANRELARRPERPRGVSPWPWDDEPWD